MDPFNAELNAVLRYQTEQERAAFEAAIDANPHDATNRLVYADWLQEQGEHTEAGFQRSMAEWHRNDGMLKPSSFGYKAAAQLTRLPEGVSSDHIDWYGRSGVMGVDYGPAAEQYRGKSAPYPDHVPYSNHNAYFWPTYRGMEAAFRKAFFAGRKSPPSES